MAENPTLDTNARQAENVFGMALLFSGIRCVIMYAIFPFVLPLIGLTGVFSSAVDLLINLVAVGAIFYSARTFWQVDYKYKWHYLPVAGVALIILGAFIIQDLIELFA